ncbi:hypothetical protein NPIL_17751 [Nephila pilipes]|uniref:Uncharacterized protein n=1 Tax=Nephila pilipes TaxID=299642 RepID=A0A8X6QXQ2_NEPPI|nr:hypothetical protein NPIL_17751 [Nephila pilipes]
MRREADSVRQLTSYPTEAGQRRRTKIFPQTEAASTEDHNYYLVIGWENIRPFHLQIRAHYHLLFCLAFPLFNAFSNPIRFLSYP